MGRIEIALRPMPDGIPKLCVLKRMHAELRSPEQDARFRREASIALQLSHDAIAQTVGVEEIDGEVILLQELIHGVDLRLLSTRLASVNERVPVGVAAHVVSEVARALGYAHAFGDLGIVHRDVTPDNIMLSFAGEVKLVDFGLARSDVDATLTTLGQVVGRPVYTAPEIWEGAQADRRADIYSLGVVLWQLLTGRQMEDRHAGGAPPAPSTHNPAVPANLDAAVARALARDPKQRFQSAGELQDALRPFRPADLRPAQALAELAARHFDVARERRVLAAEVERAMGVAGAGRAHSSTAQEHAWTTATTPLVPRSKQPIAVVAGVVAAGLAIALFQGLHARPASEAPAEIPSAMTVAPAMVPAPPALPVRAHPIGFSAGRARPPTAKPPRPAVALPAVAAEELLRRAQEAFDVGETERALALARQAAAAGARGAAHVVTGKVMMSDRRYDEAEQEFAAAVRLDPGDARAARLLALVREARRGTP